MAFLRKRRHQVVNVPAERDADAIGLAQRDIIGLADVVERKQLHHQKMHAVAAGLDQSEAGMPRGDVKEIGAKRFLHVVAEPKAEQIEIERRHRIDNFNRQHVTAQAEGAGAETGNRTAGAKRRIVDLGAVKRLETVAGGIPERNQAANAPRVGERLRLGDSFDLGFFQPGRELIQCRRPGPGSQLR
jgi:hypothetical protein